MKDHGSSLISLRLSYWDAFFFSLMVGAGETYLPAYALSVGMSEWLTGLFATVPLMAGALLQLLSPWLLVHIRSPKKWVTGAVIVQALVFLPLLYFSVTSVGNFLWLFVLSSLYWAMNFAAGPAWNFWMNQLVPEERVAHFFALRHRICQIGILLGIVGGGVALQAKWQLGPFENAFSLIFFGAFACRMLSAFFLSRKKEMVVQAIPRPAFKELFSLWTNPQYRGFFSFLFFFYIVISISSPFVTPYFLEKLNLNYHDYMFSLAALFLSKILIMPFAGSLIRKYSAKRVFFWGAMGVSPLPALWPMSNELWFIMLLQGVSGAFWGLFEVALSVTFFNQIKQQSKVLILTLYNFFNSSAVILGSLLGGQILRHFDASLGSYYFIFMFGAGLRVIVGGFYALKSRHRSELLAAGDSPAEVPHLTGALPEKVKVS